MQRNRIGIKPLWRPQFWTCSSCAVTSRALELGCDPRGRRSKESLAARLRELQSPLAGLPTPEALAEARDRAEILEKELAVTRGRGRMLRVLQGGLQPSPGLYKVARWA